MVRKKPKIDMLQELFNEVGVKYSIEDIKELTGVKNYNSLKALFSYVRNAKHIPEENRFDVRIDHNMCERVK